MGLGVVFKEQEVMGVADRGDALSIGTTSIEMNQHDGTGARRYSPLYLTVVDLEGIDGRLHEDRYQMILCNGKNGCNKGVGRNNDLVALL